ncbi:hypothetical protein FDZ74_01400 [bacterium]|nr:MAG: hypothetical protein FDZ74_01400 [bacterium]
MKVIVRNTLVLIFVLALVLSACNIKGNGQSQDKSDLSCSEGVCVFFAIEPPIIINQPNNVTVTISSTVDYPGLHLKLFSLPVEYIIFGQDSEWFYDATANQSHTFTSTVSFSSEGYYQLGVDVFIKDGFLIGDEERILIKDGDVVINPTRDPYPTSELFNPVPPPAEALATEAEPTHQPLPTPREFSPQDWLDLCGWNVTQSTDLTEWTDVHPAVEIPSSVAVNSQVDANFVVGFKDIDNPEAVLTVRAGLCGWGEGWTTTQEYQWEVELHTGIPFMAPLALQFTTSGEIPVYSVVLDEQNHRIVGETLWITVMTSD